MKKKKSTRKPARKLKTTSKKVNAGLKKGQELMHIARMIQIKGGKSKEVCASKYKLNLADCLKAAAKKRKSM